MSLGSLHPLDAVDMYSAAQRSPAHSQERYCDPKQGYCNVVPIGTAFQSLSISPPGDLPERLYLCIKKRTAQYAHTSLSATPTNTSQRPPNAARTTYMPSTLAQCQIPTIATFTHALPLPSHPCLFSASRSNIPPRNPHPLRNTTPLLILHLLHIRITATPTPHTILLLRIPFRPILVFLPPQFLIRRRSLEVRLSRKLSGRSVSRAMLDRSMPVAEVSKVVDLRRGEQGARGERVDGCIAPLDHPLATFSQTYDHICVTS